MSLQVRVMQPWNGIGGNGDIDPFRVMSGNLGTDDPMDGSLLFTAREGEMAMATTQYYGIGALSGDRPEVSGSIVSDLKYPEYPLILCSYQNNSGGDRTMFYPGFLLGGALQRQQDVQYKFLTSVRRWTESDSDRFVLDFTLGSSRTSNTIKAGVLTAHFIGYPTG